MARIQDLSRSLQFSFSSFWSLQHLTFVWSLHFFFFWFWSLQKLTFDRNHEHYASWREEGRKGREVTNPRQGERKPKKNCDGIFHPLFLSVLLFFYVERPKVIIENIWCITLWWGYSFVRLFRRSKKEWSFLQVYHHFLKSEEVHWCSFLSFSLLCALLWTLMFFSQFSPSVCCSFLAQEAHFQSWIALYFPLVVPPLNISAGTQFCQVLIKLFPLHRIRLSDNEDDDNGNEND